MDIGILDALRILVGLVLIFFLPGYLLVKALFPGRNELDKEYNLIYEIGLGMGLSIVIAILDGFLLGSVHQLIGFRDGGKGYFDTPYIVGSLLLICLLLFIAGWYRGAFPWLGRLHPSLTRVPESEKPQARHKRMDELITNLWGFSRQREKLRREVRDCERRSRSNASGMKAHYRQRLDRARGELADVEKQIRELEDRRAGELSGLEEEKERRREEKARRRRSRAWFAKEEGHVAGEEKGAPVETDTGKPDADKTPEPGETPQNPPGEPAEGMIGQNAEGEEE